MASNWRFPPPSNLQYSGPSSSVGFDNPSPFDSLPYPYPSASSSSPTTSLGVPPQTLPSAEGIRRARSSGSLERSVPSTAIHHNGFQTSWSPNSPTSTTPTTSSSTITTAQDPRYYESSQQSYEPFRRPSSTSLYPLPSEPHSANTPPRPYHRRTSSAQPAFFASSTTSGSSPPRPFTPLDGIASASSSRRPSATAAYSFSTPTSHRMKPQPSAEEVSQVSFFLFLALNFPRWYTDLYPIFWCSQFLRDMSDMLGPDAMAALSPTSCRPSYGLPQLSASSPPTTPTSRSDITEPSRQTYNVSGVLLSEEEYQQYTRSSANSNVNLTDTRRYSLTKPYQPFPSSSSSSHSYASPPHHQYYAQPYPSYDPNRPRSAPPSPLVDATGGSASFVPYYSPPQEPSFISSSSSYLRRRGSSVDAMVPRTFISTPQTNPSYGYASYPTSLPSNQPVGYPPPYIPDTPVRLAPSTPTSEPRRRIRKTAAQGKKPGVVNFVNFSPSDSKVLLSGVAPSGSSKKRGRTETNEVEEGLGESSAKSAKRKA